MKTLEPIFIDTSLRFGQMDIMQWFPEVTEDDAQSALVAVQEAADAFFSERWSDSTWMLDFEVSATKAEDGWQFIPVGEMEWEHSVAGWRVFNLWCEFTGLLAKTAHIIRGADYQKPLIEHVLREIEETRTREAVEQGRW